MTYNKKTLAIIDSGGANIASVTNALERLNINSVFTYDSDIIKEADRVILPGVGAARQAMDYLHQYELIDVIKELKQPVMGICLGMQLLFSFSEEGNTDNLDIVNGNLRKFPAKHDETDQELIVPHMGWNSIKKEQEHYLLDNIPDESFFYFVHSYYASLSEYTVASCEYGVKFTAIIAKDNFVGCQFHPEKSGKTGQAILQNFLN